MKKRLLKFLAKRCEVRKVYDKRPPSEQLTPAKFSDCADYYSLAVELRPETFAAKLYFLFGGRTKVVVVVASHDTLPPLLSGSQMELLDK